MMVNALAVGAGRLLNGAWRFFRWTPAVLLVALLAVGFAYRAGIEVLVIVALLVLQAVLLVVPWLSYHVGRWARKAVAGA